jgi:putative DNA methylase
MKKNRQHENQLSIPGVPDPPLQDKLDFNGGKPVAVRHEKEGFPEKLGKAIRLPVPDFSDCLEADFPIAQINALSNLEGNAGKPIYQMSKWWARRRSSVFRSMLIAAATEAPDDPNEAAKRVWDHYYCNHQKAGSFKRLKVLDPFMGGGTTLVEGSRLGMQMMGVDLNPVAWFVVRNELACSDPEQVKSLFDHIEAEVKPQIQPFYTTTCPRGHQGSWIDVQSGEPITIDPMELPPEQRASYRWDGPEVIYTFWAKHGPCQATGCGHRTPIFKNPVIAEKKLTAYYIPMKCPSCGHSFNAELGETRMSPSTERVSWIMSLLLPNYLKHLPGILNDTRKALA